MHLSAQFVFVAQQTAFVEIDVILGTKPSPAVERHVYPYPKRAIRTKDFLYIRNFDPDKWTTGEVKGRNPEYDFTETPWPTEPGAFSFAIDPSPSKQFLRLNRKVSDIKQFAKLSFPQWPKDELYDLTSDPNQLKNVASRPDYAATLKSMQVRLIAQLTKTNDPSAALFAENSYEQ